MANEFIARKGLIVLSNGAIVSGGLRVDTSVSASAFSGNGTGVTGVVSSSYALTSSYALNVPVTASYAITASAATSITFLPASASYASVAQAVLGGISNAETASYVLYNNVVNKPTGLVSSSAQINTGSFIGTFSGSLSGSHTGQYTGSILGVLVGSASYAINAAAANTATSSSFASTAMWSGINNVPTGIVSSSTQINTGSFIGTFSGSLSGSHTGQYTGSILGVLVGSASYALNAAAANTATSASHAVNAASSNTATSASFATTASAATSITFIPNSASYAGTDWNAVNNRPIGIVSSSGQVSYTGLTNIPIGIASSSAQVVALVNNQAITPLSVNGRNILSLATTGSNTFLGTQTFQNIVVLGSSSITNVTSSQVNIGNNKIVLNTNDVVRWGGMSIYDSGSQPQSGSIYWDSLRDLFVTEQVGSLAGSASSSMFIQGPRSSAGLGTEVGLPVNRLTKATGEGVGQYISSSQITDDGVTVTIPGIVSVGTNITIADTLYTVGTAAVNIGTFVIASIPTALYNGASFTYTVKSASSIRTGMVMAAWSASVVEFTDTSTADVGGTSDVSFTVDVLAGNARLKATAASNNWTVKTIAQAL